MRIPHYLVRRDNGTFQFRKRIPAALRHFFGGRRDFRQTLRTASPSVAVAKATLLSMRYDSIFASIERERMPNIDDFKHLTTQGQGKQYTVKTPDGLELVVDANNPADHAAAMEFMKARQAHEIELEMLRQSRAKTEAEAEAVRLAAARAEAAELMSALSAQKVAKKLTAAEAVERYAESLPATMASKTKDSKPSIVKNFLDCAKVASIDEINRAHVAEWIAALKAEGNAGTTIKRKIQWLGLFMTWAQDVGAYPMGDNPARQRTLSREKTPAENKTSPFTTDELGKVLATSALDALDTDAILVVLLAAYTGARVSELGQLYLNDVFTQDGVLCLRIDAKNSGQKVKTESSRRVVPLHSFLVPLVARRVKELRRLGQARLFPNANLKSKNGAGDRYSKAFTRHLEKLGIKTEETARTGETPRRLGFHSLRKTFIQILQNTAFPSERVEYFVGHEVPTVHHKDYVESYKPGVLLADLEKFWHPPIDAAAVAALLEGRPLERFKAPRRDMKAT